MCLAQSGVSHKYKAITLHLNRAHGITCSDYQDLFPGAPMTSSQYRTTMAAAVKAHYADPGHRAALSAAQRQAWADNKEERLAKVFSPEARAARGAAQRRRFTDPAEREKCSRAGKSGWEHATSRARLLAHRRSPEMRALTSAAVKAAHAAGRYDHVVHDKWVSAVEKDLASLLDDIGCVYRAQGRILGINKPWDFVFDEDKVILELDGCYWHGCLECYPVGDSSQRYPNETREVGQLPEKDRKQQVAAEAAGWRVIRLWEHDYAQAWDKVIAALVDAHITPFGLTSVPVPGV